MIKQCRVVRFARMGFLAALAWSGFAFAVQAAEPQKIEANRVAEVTLVSEKAYANSFAEVELDALVTQPDGTRLRVPGFWVGGNRWCFRYASGTVGTHTYRTECSDTKNPAPARR